MKNIFRFLKQYSSTPKDVDRIIISAFLEINELKTSKNLFLHSYEIKLNESDESKSLAEFISLIHLETPNFGFEELLELFEFVISPADRKITGAVYTPKNIRDFIVKEAFKKILILDRNIRISDIACGCGGFLFDAAVKLKQETGISYSEIFRNNIYGIDIQEYSITRTKLLLSLLAIQSGEDEVEFDFNLYTGDSLDFNWTTAIPGFTGFDVILGNPPYVCARNLDKTTKDKLKLWEVCNSGNPDLYIPFFQIATQNLAENGVLGFITMNTFFKSLNGRALRAYFAKKLFAISIIDFGSEQIFRSKNTYTCICLIQNIRDQFVLYNKSHSADLTKILQFQKIPYKNLDSKKGWNLKDNNAISKIESTGVPFHKLYITRHGLATLKNDIYIFKPIMEDSDYYYLQNGSQFKIEKGICKDVVNSNKLSREIDLDNLIEKVIFPYDRQENKPKLLEEELIRERFPEAYKYLMNKKDVLALRDKGNGKYEKWYAFGRTQSLEIIKNKLLFPKYSDRTPSFIINCADDLLFYNGLAVIGSDPHEMKILKKILESSVFWYYIKSTSKPYSSNYFSLNGNYIKNFGICDLNREEREFLNTEEDKVILDKFFEDKYGLKIS